MKYFERIKAVLYLLAAVLIFIFPHQIMPGVGYLVGGVILAYSVDEIVEMLHEKKYAHLAGAVIQIVIAVLMFLTAKDVERICVIWGVWSIIRESRELTEALLHIKVRRMAVVDIAESVIVLVLSAFLVMEPGEHHAFVHLIVLGIELILEILFPLLEQLLQKRFPIRKEEGKSE